jgi:uncharacterized repeat protein (TIGR03803 family)
MLLAAASLPGAAAASSFTTLYSFLGGPDGGYPFGEDVSPHGKFLFGTANGGGASLDGTVYRLNTATGAETVLYTFTGAADGCHPESPLTYSNGLYYGTTSGCGAGGHGTVFSVDPKSGAFKTLYGFTLGADGGFPSGSLLAFGGYLWGITQFGGANAAGTLFRIDPATGAEKVAYSFGKGAGAAYPDAGLVEHNGFLFGTTQSGGTNNGGTVFSYHPATGKVRVLHSFGSFGGADGYYPACELLLDGHELYGTTQNGGANSQGTIFKVDIGTGNETVLYSFTGGADGAFPYNALTPLKRISSARFSCTMSLPTR